MVEPAVDPAGRARPNDRAAASPAARAWGLAALAAGSVAVAGATVLSGRGTEPFATWHYVFAWYGTLLALDGAHRLLTRRFFLLTRPAFLVTSLGWSVPVWLFFELLNLRLRNWYYVFVPDDPVARWVGITLSFATVMPAVLISEAILGAVGLGVSTRTRPLRLTHQRLRGLRLLGWFMLVLPLVWPRWFFPLVWGAAVLLLEPTIHRRAPERSLLGDLESGQPGRPLRLLVAGAALGVLWEAYNAAARGGWIYTVPFLEELKLFEMPPLGFLGFPVFALECFVIWQALILGGVAVPRDGPAASVAGSARVGAALAAVVFSAAMLLAMERRTISSLTPRIGELGVDSAGALEAAGHDVFSLAQASAEDVALAGSLPLDQAERAVERARLATLRGIGPRNAELLRWAGIESVEQLAVADPGDLTRALERVGMEPGLEARVRVWIRGARASVQERR